MARTCEELPEHTLLELEGMLENPRYLECMLIKVPMIPLHKNHKT